jgi:hypothetical protein
MQRDENVKETILRKFRSGWLHLSIDTGLYLMTPFIDFVRKNMRTTHGSYDYMLYDSTNITEATDAFYRTATVKKTPVLP